MVQNAMTKQLYLEKNEEYYAVPQKWVSNLIDGFALRILDVGCGDGATGALLKQIGKAREVHGVEIVASAAQRAEANLDTVIVGDFENIELPYQPGSFDCILATEVLEHFADPWHAVLRLKSLLRDDGYIIASTPNIRNLTVIWGLVVRGDWHYNESGILDRTHLRFFTKSSFRDMFVQAGLTVEVLEPILMRYKLKYLGPLLFGVWRELLTLRYTCRARKNRGADMLIQDE